MLRRIIHNGRRKPRAKRAQRCRLLKLKDIFRRNQKRPIRAADQICRVVTVFARWNATSGRMARHLRDVAIMTAARTNSCNKVNGLAAVCGIPTGQKLRLAGQALPGTQVGTSFVEPL
jgi:hypothetical protein